MIAFIAALPIAVAARAGELRSKSFEDLWRQDAGQLQPAAPPDARPAVAAVVEPGPDQSGGGIVFVGDSHSAGPFGEALYQSLQALGPVTQFSVCGASINWWLDGKGQNKCGYVIRGPGRRTERQAWRRGGTPAAPDRHEELAAAIAARPRAVIVALGANKNGDLVGPGARLLRLIPASTRCVWVSPPPVPRDGSCAEYDRGDFSRTFQAIEQAAGRDCTLVDSSKYVDPRHSEACHYDSAYGARWGRGVAAEILSGF